MQTCNYSKAADKKFSNVEFYEIQSKPFSFSHSWTNTMDTSPKDI